MQEDKLNSWNTVCSSISGALLSQVKSPGFLALLDFFKLFFNETISDYFSGKQFTSHHVALKRCREKLKG